MTVTVLPTPPFSFATAIIRVLSFAIAPPPNYNCWLLVASYWSPVPGCWLKAKHAEKLFLTLIPSQLPNF
jgi:hypothetical protein